DKDYLPLTEEQKSAMKDKDIENWEKKAKTGLLHNDSILQQITISMRKSLSEPVQGVGLTLKDLGIQSRSYADNGKLYLDEDKLKSILKSKPDEVRKLLNGVSEDNPKYDRNLSTEQRQNRYSKSGIFQRLSDLIEDNISLVSNKYGQKGILLEKAGIEGDTTSSDNIITDEIEQYDKKITALTEKLAQKEENYYAKFTKLEQALSKMNQQSSWLASQFGGNG
ncbi:MAG: flagellar filament capping protein FliD, partial [Clostridia bacterium]|nr:flagellar filament capping protein FliD [Clostridia bacterium]